MTQLERLAQQVEAEYFPAPAGAAPVDIAIAAVDHARRHQHDVVIVDTAGRLHVDEAMMEEVRAIDRATGATSGCSSSTAWPARTRSTRRAHSTTALALTGVILTKADGDARGGAALSVRHVTGKPILFTGTGEKTDALEVFHPERVASRILGMGDVLSLIEQVQSSADHEKTAKLAKKDDRRAAASISATCASSSPNSTAWAGSRRCRQAADPGLAAGRARPGRRGRDPPPDRDHRFDDARERRRPAVIAASRKRRIAAGAGVPGPGGQPAPEAASADGKSHEKDEGRRAARMLRGLGGRLPAGGPR